MKRAKLMLVAIAVLATVGGALAFKANTAFNTNFCIRTVDVTNGITTTCTDDIAQFKLKGSETTGLVSYYYTTDTDANCFNGDKCTVTTTLVAEQ